MSAHISKLLSSTRKNKYFILRRCSDSSKVRHMEKLVYTLVHSTICIDYCFVFRGLFYL